MTAVEKRRWLSAHTLRLLAKAGDFAGVRPNDRGDWLNQPEHDWSSFIPVASKDAKAGNTDKVIFRLFASSIKTNRDEWVYAFSKTELSRRIKYFINAFNVQLKIGSSDAEALDYSIKWSRDIKRKAPRITSLTYQNNLIVKSLWRPFVSKQFYAERVMNDVLTGLHFQIHGEELESDNFVINFPGIPINKPFSILISSIPTDYHFIGDANLLALWLYASDHTRHDNITDWALNQFRSHYPDETLVKRDIFDYVYAVLHNPNYREKYALNLKAEFPRIPFYADFRRWADWGKQLVDLHTGYVDLPGTPLTRTDTLPNKTPKQATLLGMDPDSGTQEPLPLYEQAPKCKLKAHPGAGAIEIDSVTRLDGIPPEAWQYRLGNRSALEWVLEEYREKTPKDPTIREKFNLYRFADHKEAVIRLLAQVCQVSVETVAITESMRETGEA